MSKNEKPKNLFKYVLKPVFSLFGLFCEASQTAYLPETPHSDFLYSRMTGSHAVAFGGSIFLFVASSEFAEKLKKRKGKDLTFGTVRGIGFLVTAAGFYYAMLSQHSNNRQDCGTLGSVSVCGWQTFLNRCFLGVIRLK